ncbi:hypothetical protein V2G26_014017 [Clonostachys chloroleuca]
MMEGDGSQWSSSAQVNVSESLSIPAAPHRPLLLHSLRYEDSTSASVQGLPTSIANRGRRITSPAMISWGNQSVFASSLARRSDETDSKTPTLIQTVSPNRTHQYWATVVFYYMLTPERHRCFTTVPSWPNLLARASPRITMVGLQPYRNRHGRLKKDRVSKPA